MNQEENEEVVFNETAPLNEVSGTEITEQPPAVEEVQGEQEETEQA